MVLCLYKSHGCITSYAHNCSLIWSTLHTELLLGSIYMRLWRTHQNNFRLSHYNNAILNMKKGSLDRQEMWLNQQQIVNHKTLLECCHQCWRGKESLANQRSSSTNDRKWIYGRTYGNFENWSSTWPIMLKIWKRKFAEFRNRGISARHFRARILPRPFLLAGWVWGPDYCTPACCFIVHISRVSTRCTCKS